MTLDELIEKLQKIQREVKKASPRGIAIVNVATPDDMDNSSLANVVFDIVDIDKFIYQTFDSEVTLIVE